jgi:uncharacterized protein (DUF1499 family)
MQKSILARQVNFSVSPMRKIYMKIVLIVITALIIFIVFSLIVLSKTSKSRNAKGLLNGKLQECPDKPNCVCSEQNDDIDHFIQPLVITDNSVGNKLKTLKEIIIELRGKIQTDNETYISATFSSSIFGFVDDFEMRIDSKQNVIHIRSSSRVGYSDLGANKKRVELIKKLFFERTSNGQQID